MINFSRDTLHLLQTRENYVHIIYTICSLQHRRVNKMTHGGGVLTGALNWFSNILFSEL